MNYMIVKNRLDNFPKASDNQLETLSVYEEFAKRAIAAFARGLAGEMLNSEDAISFVTYEIIIADLTWKESAASKTTYRCSRAKYAIKNWLKNKYRKSESMTVSLNAADESGQQYIDYIENKSDNTEEKNQTQENIDYVHYLLRQTFLTKMQRQCIEMYYFERMTLKTISQKVGVCIQAVHQSIADGINEIKFTVGAA